MIDIKTKVKAINEFIFYDLEKKNTYKVYRLGCKFGIINEKYPFYNKWIVVENPNSHEIRTLKNNGFFIPNSTLEANGITMDSHYNELSFDNMDEAINLLFKIFPNLTV